MGSCCMKMAMRNSVVERSETERETKTGLGLGDMPELCIDRILAFTTPNDVCRLAAVSQLFNRVANSDTVWEMMLPINYHNILSRALNPIVFVSKMELYFRLCHSILTDAGAKSVWLERSTGKICYMLSARDLTITWGNDDRYWRWVSRDDSRFEQVAELHAVCWFEVKGRIECTQLSPNTVYTVSFVLKFADRNYGWETVPVKFSVTTQYGERQKSACRSACCFIEIGQGSKTCSRHGDDGWMEFVAGVFTVEESGGEPSSVEFCMEEVEGGQLKSGLILDGVKIEPKCSSSSSDSAFVM